MKGQAVSIDFMTAMTIFIIMIAAGFYIVQSSFVPEGGFIQQVEDAADTGLSNFRESTRWTVYRNPVIISSSQSLKNEPVAIDYPFSRDILKNSVLVTQDGKELRSQHDLLTNDTVMVTDIREGKNRFDIVYTKTGNLEDRNYSSGLEHSGESAWNDQLNVTFTANGFSQLEFENTDLLQDNAHLAGSSDPFFDHGLLKVNASYSSGRKHIKLFEDSGQIRVREFFTGERDWELNLTSRFDTAYTPGEGVINLETSRTGIYTGTTDWIDFNDSDQGLSIIGENIYVNVSRDAPTSELDVRITFSDTGGKKDLLLYAHKDDYNNATDQKQEFYSPYDTTLGVPEPVEGVSRQRAAELESGDYEYVKELLGLTGLEYNISIEDTFKHGKNVPTGRTVTVLEFPVPVVERFGNASKRDMVMRIWQ
ncbi:MAG: hypothetical protein MUP63_01980 [Candidatus Nanohaloarchaeota archaeon QJJ-7]|nr:hypothetical protein [Candidatus Nanohaloarchaeota archaeon QJJ-7]